MLKDEKYKYRDREEFVYNFDGEIPDEVLKSYKKIQYPNGYVTTIYFGGESKLWHGTKLLSHAAIKVRYYSSSTTGDMFVPSLDQPCIVEIKRRFPDSNKKNYRSKIRIDNVNYNPNSRYSLSLKDAITILANKDGANKYEGIIDSIFIDDIHKIFEEYKLSSLKPVAATSYHRKHFENDSERITIDDNLKYFLSTTHEEDIIFLCVKKLKENVLEFKTSKDNTDLAKKLSQYGVDLRPVPGNETKGAMLFNLVNTEQVSFIEPELDLKSESDWVITERESKIDIEQDPRQIITNNLFRGNPSLITGNSNSINTYLRFYLIGKESLCTMQWKSDSRSNISIKYKTTISNNNGVLVRKEVVEPYSDKKLKDILKKFKFFAEPKTTPLIDRARTSFSIYLPDTQHVFRIYCDHCSVDAMGYNDLNQIEVEYEGIITKSSTDVYNLDINKITREIKTFSEYVMTQLNNLKISYTFPGTTKYDWIKEEYKKIHPTSE